MSDHLASFMDAMSSHGINLTEPLIADGKLHRYHVHGDHRSKRNAWAVIHLDERPAGMFGCLKRTGAEKIVWKADGVKRMTPAERIAMRARMRRESAAREAQQRAQYDAAAVRANEIWDAAAPCESHPYLKRKRIPSLGFRVTEWVKEYHDPETGEVTEKKIKNALLIPLRNERKEIRSLQAIFVSDKNPLGRDRDFLAGGEKKGLWFTIGTPAEYDGQVTIAIAEGVATAASIHVATDLGVVVAFDAGNLVPVAQKARGLMPHARIVVCADDDRLTTAPINNPGVTYATRAAEAVGGIVAIPKFKDEDSRGSDFNDLACAEGGSDVVRTQVFAAITGPAPEAEISTEAAPEPETEKQKKKRKPRPTVDLDMGRDSSSYFRVLGYDKTQFHVYSHEMNTVESAKKRDWNRMLLTIAPLEWWEQNFRAESVQGQGWEKAALNWLIRLAARRGYYDPSVERGRGAWKDKDRLVYHFGDHLVVDGERIDLGKLPESKFCYVRRATMPDADLDPLSNEEGLKLLNLAKRFRWVRPASGVLLAGWCALAPLGGALRWRPHIWITGGAGAGKSTVLKYFVNTLMNGTGVFVDGKTTEAGVRADLGSDALPVLFEESEKTNDGDHVRIQNILSMARSSASESGARTVKGTSSGEAKSYLIRSMFCLCSIALGIEMQADFERFSVLALQSKRTAGRTGEQAGKEWKELENVLEELERDEELPRRLMRRSLDLMPITLKNIKIFSEAAAAKFGSQREGDQYGALMAGAWSLVSKIEATPEQARKMFDRYDWTEYFENAEDPDTNKALSTVLQTIIRVGAHQVSIFELICAAHGQKTEGVKVDQAEAVATLKRHGIAIKNDGQWIVLISQNPVELLRLIERTPYRGDLKSHLLQATGAFKYEKTVSFGGINARCIAIPIHNILHADDLPALPYEPGEELDPPW